MTSSPETRLRSWKRVLVDGPQWLRVLAPEIIAQIEAEIAARKAK